MVVSGGAELLTLGAIFPFLSVLSNPQELWRQSWVQALAKQAGLNSASQILLPVTLGFALSAVIVALIRLINIGLNVRLAAAVGSDLSSEAYLRTLCQPYEVHVQRNSASVITSITTQIPQVVTALNALFNMISSAAISIWLIVGLLLIDTKVALVSAALFAVIYSVLAFRSSRELLANSEKIAKANIQRLKALQEGLGSVRDVLLDGSQATYLQIYQRADRPSRQLEAKNLFIQSYPRYILEASGMVAIALLGWFLVMQMGRGPGVIPFLGVIALGAQRLLPALHSVYAGWAALKSYNSALYGVLEMLSQALPPQLSAASPMPLSEIIQMQGIHFRYSPILPEVLRGLNLQIRRGERIGLIGVTGSGKTTLVDLLMGLLRPTAGRFLVDGADLHDPLHPERLVAWRAGIAHVPQTIYLADSSIAENIAFGIPRKLVDISKVRQAASQAKIAEFIESLPEGYNTFVGERGIRLSGGQRQRIGIARALYKSASIIVLDEATSALDHVTEESVMSSVESLNKDLTIVMIAHRLTTVQRCDRIVCLSGGLILTEQHLHDKMSSIN